MDTCQIDQHQRGLVKLEKKIKLDHLIHWPNQYKMENLGIRTEHTFSVQVIIQIIKFSNFYFHFVMGFLRLEAKPKALQCNL